MVLWETIIQMHCIELLEKCHQKVPVRQPGVEPGSIAWKATMLTATPLTLNTLSLSILRCVHLSKRGNLPLPAWRAIEKQPQHQ